MTTKIRAILANSQLCPRTGLHPTLDAFAAFFAPPTKPEPVEPKPKRVQVLSQVQLERQRANTRAWINKNRDERNAQKRAEYANARELQAIPSRDILLHEPKPVTTASSRFATA